MVTFRGLLSCICISLILVSSVNAGVENRPLNTDDAYILDKGMLTISLGAVSIREANGDKETDFNIDLGYGISNRLEITVDIPVIFSDPKAGSNGEGLGDISIRPEVFLVNEREYMPAISFAATLKTHSGNKANYLGSGETDYSLSFQFSKDFSPLKWHFNIGYTFVGQAKGEAIDDVIFYNLAFEYNVNDRIDVVGELVGQTNPGPNADDETFEFLVGCIYSMSQNIALDFGIGAGLTDASPDLRITSGLTFQF